MATGKRIKHYRQKAGWKLADLSDASGVDVGTISALENRDSKRSENFGPIARAFGLTVDQLQDEFTDHEIHVGKWPAVATPTFDIAPPESSALLFSNRAVVASENIPAIWPTAPNYDELTVEAIKIMQGLDKSQKFAMLAKMREFKQHLDPPRIGQAL